MQKNFLYQQCNRIYLVMLFALVVIAGATYGVVQVREQQLNLVANQVPVITKQQQQLVFIDQAKQHLNYLLFSSQPTDFIEHHQLLEKRLRLLLRENKHLQYQDFPYLKDLNQSQQIIRIAGQNGKSTETIELTTNKIIAVSNMLNSLIVAKEKRAAHLSYLIRTDFIDNSVTARRVTDYTSLTRSIGNARLAFTQLQIMLIQMPYINLQMQPQVIDNIAKQSSLFFTWFAEQEINIRKDNNALAQEIVSLEQMLLIDQRLLAKWQSYLQIYLAHKKLLHSELLHLNALFEQISTTSGTAPLISPSIKITFPDAIQRAIQQTGFVLTLKNIEVIAYSSFIVGVFILLFAWRRLAIRIKLASSATHHSTNKVPADVIDVVDEENDERIPPMQEQLIAPLPSDVEIKQEQEHRQEVNSEGVPFEELVQVISQLPTIDYWQLSRGYNNNAIVQLLTTLTPPVKQPVSIRHLFEKSSLTYLFATARQVKSLHNVQVVILTLLTGQRVQLSLTYQGFWFGLVVVEPSDGEQKNALSNELQQSQLALSHAQLQQKEQEHQEQQQLLTLQVSNKVIKAMLQSQAECLTKKQALPYFYRHFNRILWLAKDNNLISNLKQITYQPSIESVYLSQQLVVVLSNVNRVSQARKNRVQLNDWLAQLTKVNLEDELFNALITHVTQLLLVGQQCAELLLTTRLIDQTKDSYSVQYQFDLHAMNIIKQLPKALLALQFPDQAPDKDSIEILQPLFEKLSTFNIESHLTDQGYQFSFNLTHQRDINSEALTTNLSFAHQHVVIFGAPSLHRHIVEATYVEQGGNVDTVDDNEQLLQRLTSEQLKLNSINLLVVLDDGTQNLTLIHQAIECLPDMLSPKLYVCQFKVSKYFSIDHYCQPLLPLDKHALLSKNKKLLLNEQRDNRCSTAPSTSKITYVHTGIEVIIAAVDVSQHHALVGSLMAFGFQITFVNTPSSMMNLWQSGQYLLLFSEFNETPVVEMRNGKQVQRGLFTFSTDHCQQWQQQLNNSQWQIGVVEQPVNVKQLSILLKTWLVPEEEVVNNKRSTTEKDLLTTPLHSPEALLHFADLEPAFDLQKYANNQAGVEFAALMLDDYLADNKDLLEKIRYALSVKSTEQIGLYLGKLNNNAKTLAADNLSKCCQLIEATVREQNFYQAEMLLTDLEQQIDLVAHYADAI